MKGDHGDAITSVFAMRALVGMLGFIDMFGGGGERGLRGLERNSGTEPGEHAGGVAPALTRIERDGNPEVDLAGAHVEIEIGRHDADHAAGMCAFLDGFSEDRGIASKASQEKRVADDDGGVGSGAIFFGCEDAAGDGARGQHGEDFRADGHQGNAFRRAGERGVIPEDATGQLEDFVEVTIGVGGVILGGAARQVEFYELVPHHHQAAGIGVGKRAQEDGVDDAEDGGVGSDAEGER